MRTDLTDHQLRQLLTELIPLLNHSQLNRVRQVVQELHTLRDRESVTLYLHDIEGIV